LVHLNAEKLSSSVSSCREGIGDEHFHKLLTTENAGLGSENASKYGYHKVVS
jgi:hypothetical protein